MLVMSRGALSAERAEQYYAEKYSADDYYSEERRVVGEWFGKGAAILELSGSVAHQDFLAVLRGIDPASGSVLVSNANGRTDRRAGWDATFNAPKSLSIQALVGDDSNLIEAHRRAVSRALAELEHYSLSRRHGGREWVLTENIVAARFDHIAARPARYTDDHYGPDPHLHTHVVIANMTRRSDRAWRGLDPVEIYRSQAFATAVYRSELAREVQRLGYQIDITGADSRWELEGYTRDQLMSFSRRRQDIESALSKLGLTGAAAAQIIAHRTRGSKKTHNEDDLRAEWKARAASYGIEPEQIARRARVRNPIHPGQEKVRDALRFSVAHNTEREAVVDRRALEASALKHAMGKGDLDGVRREIADWERTGELITATVEVSSPQGAYTTPDMVALERENLDLLHAGQGAAHAIAGREQVRRWAADRGMFPDQTAAAVVTLTATDWLTSIEGHAGTAKTSTVGVIREFAEQQGYSVSAFAPTTRAVKALAEAGLEAHTVASLFENPSREHHGKQLWIVDESSLLGTHQVNRMLHQARDAGVARMIFVGDERQHHAIEAGRPVHQMQRAGILVARLERIRRQRDSHLREVVRFAARGDVDKAIAVLDEQHRIHEIADASQRHTAIANEYVSARELGERVLVVSPANDERRLLNDIIHQSLMDRGHIAPSGSEQIILVNRDLTRAQRVHALSYAVDNVVRFTRGSRRLRLGRGVYARIEETDPEHNRITARTEAGELVEYNPARLSGAQVFYEERRRFANGDRIQFRAADSTLGVANGDFATVLAIDDKRVALRLEPGKEFSAPRASLRHVDYGYASTSHSSLGATVDRVIVNIDTQRSAELVNRKQFYVSVSRGRNNLTLYTDDRMRLNGVVRRSREKSVALDRLHISPQLRLTVVDEPRLQRPNNAYGIRR